jgi:hypothetical protein
LVEIVDGLGFVEGGKFGDLDVGVAEESECVAEIFFAVADVGAQGDVDGGRHLYGAIIDVARRVWGDSYRDL